MNNSILSLLQLAIAYYNEKKHPSNLTNYLNSTVSSTSKVISTTEVISTTVIPTTEVISTTVIPTTEVISTTENHSAIEKQYVNNLNMNFLASIQRRSDQQNLCIGSLITFDFVLITCSCVLYVEKNTTEFPYGYPKDYVVYGGYFDKLSYRNISKFVLDERCEFMSDFWLNNNGYVRLEEPFYNYGTVPNLKYPEIYESLLHKILDDVTYTSNGVNYCTTFAWDPKGALNKDLVMKTVQFATHEECSSVLCNSSSCEEALRSQSVFCAGDFTSGTKTYFTNWDQGAPILCVNNLIGVLSLSPLRKRESSLNMFNKLNMKDMVDLSNVEVSKSRKIQNSVCLIIVCFKHLL